MEEEVSGAGRGKWRKRKAEEEGVSGGGVGKWRRKRKVEEKGVSE